jgi:hypothetical protein
MRLRHFVVAAVVVTVVSAGVLDDFHKVLSSEAVVNVDVSGNAQFTCDGTKLLDHGQVNDDYCDCDDGSDETRTSACAYTAIEV